MAFMKNLFLFNTKRWNLGLILTLCLLTSCISPIQSLGPSDSHELSLAEVIDGLNELGDLSARAVVTADIAGYFEDDPTKPRTFYLINEGNISLGWSEYNSSKPTEFSIGDTPLKKYLVSMGLGEEEFLAHPKLKEFLLSHLVLGRETFTNSEIRSKEFLNAVGNIVSVKSGQYNTIGIEFFVNDIPVTYCNYDSTFYQRVRLCYINQPLLTDFDWNN